jgi:hypothetical protein
MTAPTDSPGNVPGQLDLHGFTPEEAADFSSAFSDRLTELAAERERLDLAVLEHRATALQDVTRYTAETATASAALDRAVAEARGVGATWEQIGAAAGMARQSAWKRWGDR